MTPEELEEQKRRQAAIVDWAKGQVGADQPQSAVPSTGSSGNADAARAALNQLAPPQTPAADVQPAPAEQQPSQVINQSQGTGRPSTIDKVLAMLSDRVLNDKGTPEEQAMQKQWGQIEKQKLNQLSNQGDSAQDWAMGLGTAIPMLAGTLLQAASPQRSRGIYAPPMESGLGKIAEAGIQGANALGQQRQQRDQAAAALAQQAQAVRRGYADKDFDRLSKLGTMLSDRDRIQIAMQQSGLRGNEAQLKADAQAYRLDPKNPQANAMRDVIYKYAPQLKGTLEDAGTDVLSKLGYQIQQNTKDAHFGTELSQAFAKSATEATASTNARSAAEAANAPQDAQTAATVQAGGTLGRGGAEQQLTTGEYLAPIGRDVVDDERVAKVRGNKELTKQSNSEMRGSQEMVSAISDMVDLRKKQAQGIAIPGGYQSAFEAKKSKLMGAIAKANGMGSIQEGDRQAIDSYLSNTSLSTQDLVSGLFGSDIKLNQLQGVQKALQDFDKDTAEWWGYSSYAGFRKKKPGAKPAAPNAPAAPASAVPKALEDL